MLQSPSRITAPSSVRLPHDCITNTVPLEGFRMLPCLGAVHETKWFGSEEYRVGDTVVLTCGGEMLGKGEVSQRG